MAHAVDVYRRALNACTGFLPNPVPVTSQVLQSWQELLPELVGELAKWSSRDLGTGFFLPKHQKVAAAHSRGRGGLSPLLARLEEEIRPQVWRVSVRSQWDQSRDAYVFMPGGNKPPLNAGAYALEDHRGERVDRVHPGMEAVLHTEQSGLVSGAYVEAL